MPRKKLAIDIGMTNIDLILKSNSEYVMKMIRNREPLAVDQVRQALSAIERHLTPDMHIGVTGGHYRELPPIVDGYKLHQVNEMLALGRGGLILANAESGLVVSAGTGVAMVAATTDDVRHVTGSAVGGGTLLGLSRLILNTVNVIEIDQLAQAGDASAVDIMLSEAVGGEVGLLPSNANAVNLGKLDRWNSFSRENLAAGLVRLVAQVIAVIAINAANSVDLEKIILVGHLMDLESIRKEINLVGEFYDRDFIVPEKPGFGTAMGVMTMLSKLGVTDPL